MKLSNIIPEPVQSRMRKFYYGILDVQVWDKKSKALPGLGWYIHPKANSNRIRLGVFEGKHEGKRCFILGNGPSLKTMNLSPLRDEFTFGLNRIFLLFQKIGFQTSYFVAVNQLVIEQSIDEINSLKMPKFINWYARQFFGFNRSIFYIRDAYDGSEGFAKNPIWRIWEGATVTYVAMQLAYFMGFKQVILIGVDHHFETKGEPHTIVTTNGNDFNHFDSAYFGHGFRWQLPDLDTSEQAYRLAKKVYEESGREILDATVNGKLHVFPKIDYQSLF